MSLQLKDGHLTPDQVKSYWENGYIFPMRVMTQARAAELRTELEELEHTWLDNGLPLPLNTYKRVNAHVVMPVAHTIGQTSSILDVVEDVLGPDIILYSVEFLIKEPNTTHVVTMHQDLTYWGLGEIDTLTTAWLALSDATTASGCMDFVQSSHKNPILPHTDKFSANNLLSRGQEIEVDIAEADKTPVELMAGELSLHHGLTIHGSGPNTSDDRRIGVAIRYTTPALKKPNGGREFGQLVRGQNTYDNFTEVPVPETAFAYENLVAYDKIREAQTKDLMAGATQQSQFYNKV